MQLAQPNSGQEASAATSPVPPSILSKSLPEAERGWVPSQRGRLVAIACPLLSSSVSPSLLSFPWLPSALEQAS